MLVACLPMLANVGTRWIFLNYFLVRTKKQSSCYLNYGSRGALWSSVEFFGGRGQVGDTGEHEQETCPPISVTSICKKNECSILEEREQEECPPFL